MILACLVCYDQFARDPCAIQLDELTLLERRDSMFT